MAWSPVWLAGGLLMALGALSASAASNGGEPLRLDVDAEAGAVHARLSRAADGFVYADGPMVLRAQETGLPAVAALQNARVWSRGRSLTLTGLLGELAVRIEWSTPAGKPWIEERVTLRNASRRTLRMADLEIGFTRDVAGAENDVLTAVPFRKRATDPADRTHEFTLHDLVHPPVGEPSVGPFEVSFTAPGMVPSRHKLSEAWAWQRAGGSLGIFRFCQDHLQLSVVSRVDDGSARIRFGGAVMHFGEPSELQRLRPGERVDLGVTRYQMVDGGYENVAYAYRAMLDVSGCRFPANYNPPVHWEQLYDMEGAWNHRKEQYTRAAVEAEAKKGIAYGCEALYLDPGWDTAFATWIWGQEWLGSQRAFADMLRKQYGLGLALHCPVATWMSMKGWSMGPFAADSWPADARRKPSESSADSPQRVPAVVQNRRNLALLPEVTASASSVWEGGKVAIHQIDHLVDGWYGNTASWIAAEMPCWAEVDLGGAHRIDEVRIGNDALAQYTDRSAVDFRILVGAGDGELKPVVERRGEHLLGTTAYRFDPVEARCIRVEITRSDGGVARLDEIEVYEAEPVSPADAAAFETSARRGPQPKPVAPGALICMGAKQYLSEAERRMDRLCQDGAVFLMFDGTWWTGTCWDRHHGHPVPYLPEDHIRANLALAQRVHKRYPKVLIEMHDMLAGGNSARPTPVYYKYGLPGSYDENWGLELMWDPMADLRSGRGFALYYYNLACNVPIYLHIDLRKDNLSCVVLWWYASTCRHLGIGGTHKDPRVVEAQQAAMRTYRRLERFYKRGDFYGAGPEIHVHALRSENACVVNAFNVTDGARVVTGEIPLATMGLDARRAYRASQPWASVEGGVLRVRADLAAWGAGVCEITSEAR